MTLDQPSRRHYVAIFLIAFATLAVQLLLSRIFSVTLYYHYAFAGITFAMLGLTAGALKVYSHPEKFTAERADAVLAQYTSRFAITFVIAVLLHMYGPGMVLAMNSPSLSSVPFTIVLLSFTLLIFAFMESGVCIALLLTRFPSQVGSLYASDLAGAAAGCLAIIAVLWFLDPIGVTLVLGALLAVLSWYLLPKNESYFHTQSVRWVAVILLGLSAFQVGSCIYGTPLMRLTWAKNRVIAEAPLFERWNTYSRIAVTEYKDRAPFGWGYGVTHRNSIAQKELTIDAEAATVITNFDGDTSKIRYLQDDVTNLAYHIRSVKSTAVIGVGGGRDILSAIVAGVPAITGIELNPATFEALTKRFAHFTGELHKRPDVSLVNAEARSHLASHKQNYDLIQISLIDTWATTVAGGLTLSENKLYTKQAWQEFMSRLNGDGILTVSRWYEPNTHKSEFYRLLAITADALREKDPTVDPRQHIMAARAGLVMTMLVSKSPFTEKEMRRFELACENLRLTPVIAPAFEPDGTAIRIASGTADQRFYQSLPVDVSASTDDRPFFFHTLRLTGLLNEDTQQEYKTDGFSFSHHRAIVTLVGIFFVTFAASSWFILSPLMRLHKRHDVPFKTLMPHMLYFAGIGLGFMLVEMSQMQRLMIFLGHPAYGLSVVLFTLLLSSAIGSYLQQFWRLPDNKLWLKPGALVAVLIAIGLIMPHLTEHLKQYNIPVRIVASAAVIAVMGLFMGMLFPLGISVAGKRYDSLLPWFWGINGAASVFASVLAVILSLQFGISISYWAGVACYAVCVWVLFKRTP